MPSMGYYYQPMNPVEKARIKRAEERKEARRWKGWKHHGR